MVRYYFGLVFLVALLGLLTASLGWCSVQKENQSVLMKSKISSRYQKGILQRIKQALPRNLKSCSIAVVDIIFLQREYKYPSAAEEWTVNVCQEKRVYFVADESPKGKYYTITPKEERLAKEKKIWDTVRNDDKDGEWRATLFYIDEIESIKDVVPGTQK